jgi:hypothetical protein
VARGPVVLTPGAGLPPAWVRCGSAGGCVAGPYGVLPLENRGALEIITT